MSVDRGMSVARGIRANCCNCPKTGGMLYWHNIPEGYTGQFYDRGHRSAYLCLTCSIDMLVDIGHSESTGEPVSVIRDPNDTTPEFDFTDTDGGFVVTITKGGDGS